MFLLRIGEIPLRKGQERKYEFFTLGYRISLGKQLERNIIRDVLVATSKSRSCYE